MHQRRRAHCRRGATVVEFAVVAVVMFPLLFSLLEYCRYVFVRQLLENAAREGARYAVVHTQDPSTTLIEEIVLARMAGQQGNVSGFDIDVFRSDPTTGANLGTWNDAQFGDMITVRITGNYYPLAGWMNTSLPIDVRAVMASEAN